MKLKKRKIIPHEIFKYFNIKFTNTQGRESFAYKVISELRKFLNSSFITENYPELNTYFRKGISLDIVYRATNQKKPNGASPQLRNLLALYCSDGKLTWNKLIKEQFSEFKNLKDKEYTTRAIHSKSTFKRQIKNKTLEEYENLISRSSNNERELILKQVVNETIQRKNQIITDLIKLKPLTPQNPEFPPAPFYKPTWPASKTYSINVPNFTNVFLKDESTNPTGTHKARMGWEVTVNCAKYNIKEISLISSGSAAIAIQFFLKLFHVNTKLKVLLDKNINDEIKSSLRKAGCYIHEEDLRKKELNDYQIRKLTYNKNGVDTTYRETMDIHSIKYYDWMSYEIINQNPDYCFIPFGTGDLFVNILKIMSHEFYNRNFEPDSRFNGNINTLKKCNFLAASTKDSLSKMDKLFAFHLPSFKKTETFVEDLKKSKAIGQLSGIYNVEEKYVDLALEIAELNDINCEPSGIAGIALMLQMKNLLQIGKKILIINTGKTDYFPNIPPIKIR